MNQLTLASVLLAAAGSCEAEYDICVLRTDCIEIEFGEIKIDGDKGTFEIGGLCAKILNSACPNLDSILYQVGIDENGNGQLDKGEASQTFFDENPGTKACITKSSGKWGGQKGDVIAHVEVKVEGQEQPVLSKTVKGTPK